VRTTLDQDGAQVPQPARWYVLDDGEQTGPFELAQLRERVLGGSLTADTWVWADGMPEWRQAREVPALVPPSEHDVAGWTP
jgi:hypothetical protein